MPRKVRKVLAYSECLSYWRRDYHLHLAECDRHPAARRAVSPVFSFVPTEKCFTCSVVIKLIVEEFEKR